MGLLYNYTYLNANGYLQKFRDALGAPLLDRATLTKLLKIFNDRHKLVRFIVPAEPGGPKCLYYKDTLNTILGIDRTGMEIRGRKNNTYLNELNDILAGIDEKEYMKSRPRQEEPIDYRSDEEDMQKMSDMMANLEEDKKENFMVNEDFSSPILSRMAKEHGGIQISRNGGLRQFPCAFLRGNGVNPSEITDDMIVGEPFEYSPYDRKSDNAVLFNDGTAIALNKNAELPRRTSGQRRNDRYGSGIGDTGDHDKSRGGFVGKGKDAMSSPYNGWQSSERAGYSQSLRDAYRINKKMGDEKTVNDILNKARNIYITEEQLSQLHTHKMKNTKSIIITEEQENELKKALSENYFVETDKVKVVRDFLDSHFERGANPVIGGDGYPSMKPIMGLKIGDPNNSTKPMTPSQVFYMLQDRFKGMYSDRRQRDAFLKQVLIDWYNKGISYDGMLSRNNVQ